MTAVAAAARARLLRRVSERFLLLSALSFGVFVASPMLFLAFEAHSSPVVHSVPTAYAWLTRTLIEGASAYQVTTEGGRVVYYLVKLSGISVVAFATGSISSRLVAAVVTKGRGMGSTKANGHILICGWSGKGAEILRELRAKEVDDRRPVVVLANLPEDPSRGLAEFIAGDPSDVADLRRAGIEHAATAIVLADESSLPATDSDRDARTLLTCLALESVNPDCYSCVEVVRSENRDHFSRTRADELVVSAELTGALLASSARTHGLSAVVSDLLTHPEGSEFYHLPVPAELTAKTVREAMGWVKDNLDAMLVGVGGAKTRFELNPPAARQLLAEELLLVVAARAPIGSRK